MQILISGEAGFSVGMTGSVLIHHFGMVMQASLSDPKRRPTPSRILPISKRSGTELCEAIGLHGGGPISETNGSSGASYFDMGIH